MGIVARHPIAAPVAAPPKPPCVVFATGLGLHAARPVTSAIALYSLIIYSLFPISEISLVS
jgi:hypothetical protein